MDLGLSGKVAIITGSSRGLGLASAMALAAEGCRVVLCGRTASTLADATRQVAAVASAGAVHAVQADVSTSDGVQSVTEGAVTRFGGIDVLVNNVGLARGGSLLETTD